MKQAVLTAPYAISVEQAPIPVPEEREILVRLRYCGLCTLEQRLYSGETVMGYPVVPGHEAAGTVAALGSRAETDLWPGDPVALDLAYRCHRCRYCRSGRSNLCENRFKPEAPRLGGLSEYIVVRPEQAYALPAGLPLEDAALAEPLACCLHSLGKLGLLSGENLLIAGAGAMGLLHLMLARGMGVQPLLSDVDDARLQAARQVGGGTVLDASDREAFRQRVRTLTGGRGVDACVVTARSPAVLEDLTELLAPGARVVIYTSYEGTRTLPFDLNTLHRREYTVTGTEGRTEHDFQQAVALLAAGDIKPAVLISHIFTWDELEEAFAAASSLATYRVLLQTSTPE